MADLHDMISDAFRGAPRRPRPTREALDVAPAPVAYGGRRWDGGKYPGGYTDRAGYGDTPWSDYETLRARSETLFKTNTYARGMLRRLITNEIHTGLAPEASPVAAVLGLTPEAALNWGNEAEVRFKFWADNATVCHASGQLVYGQIQAQVRLEALAGGDCLVVLRQHPATELPTVQIVPASKVCGCSLDSIPAGHVVRYGVEMDGAGTHVAYHVSTSNTSNGATVTQRIPARDENTGRARAWLVYGTDRRANDVRGEPLLALIMQSLNDLDKYRDAALRKAVINATLAMFITKDQPLPGTKAITGGAVRAGTVSSGWTADGVIPERDFRLTEMVPGTVMEELQHGERPVAFGADGTDINLPLFEQAVISALAWACQIPYEILTLAFSSNYSASAAALNEFKIYLELARVDMARQLLGTVWGEWVISEVLRGAMKAPGLIAATLDLAKFDVVGAWLEADWAGAIKPTTDPLKMVRALLEAVAGGLMTRAYATKLYTGRKFDSNIVILGRENTLLAQANAPLEPPPAPVRASAPAAPTDEPEEKEEDEDEPK